jgi:hypothetical protein
MDIIAKYFNYIVVLLVFFWMALTLYWRRVRKGTITSVDEIRSATDFPFTVIGLLDKGYSANRVFLNGHGYNLRKGMVLNYREGPECIFYYEMDGIATHSMMRKPYTSLCNFLEYYEVVGSGRK